MSYERIDYLKKDGSASSAYYERSSREAWDVFSRMPVILKQSDSGNYLEWEPEKQQEKQTPQRGTSATRVKLVGSPWVIVTIMFIILILTLLFIHNQEIHSLILPTPTYSPQNLFPNG